MKNQDGGLNALVRPLAMSCLNRCKISLVPKHQLIVPSTLLALATNIRTYKATKIHTLTPLTYELFFQNSSKIVWKVGAVCLLFNLWFTSGILNKSTVSESRKVPYDDLCGQRESFTGNLTMFRPY